MKRICLTAEEISQILAKEKTMARKVIKPQPTTFEGNELVYINWKTLDMKYIISPYQIGEIIYCAESWMLHQSKVSYLDDIIVCYKDINTNLIPQKIDFTELEKWYSPIFMPEIYSRCKIRITDIKAERLHDITEDDALASGVERNCSEYPKPCTQCSSDCNGRNEFLKYDSHGEISDDFPAWTAKESFQSWWNYKNPKNNWESNPWVWVISFELTNEVK